MTNQAKSSLRLSFLIVATLSRHVLISGDLCAVADAIGILATVNLDGATDAVYERAGYHLPYRAE
jgi:hypothetical protein